jgi:hypothetical protein
MYTDSDLMMASAQAAYGSAGTVYGPYSVDMGDTGKYADLGKGRPVAVQFTVDTAFAGTTGSLILFQVLADVDLTMDASSKIIVQTGPIPVTALTIGKVVTIPIPAGVIPLFGTTYDHLGVAIETTTQTSSAGAVTAVVVMDW